MLIIRTGFTKKIHAMPVIAMCGNIAWEVMLGMGTIVPTLEQRCPACRGDRLRPETRPGSQRAP